MVQTKVAVNGFQVGVRFGIVSGGLALVHTILGAANVDGFVIGLIFLVAGLALYGVCGYYTTHSGGTVEGATIAGLTVGWLGAAIGTVITVVFYIVTPNAVKSLPIGSDVAVGAIILIGLVEIILSVGIGAGAGAIGGLIGRQNTQKA